ncbi:YncE family protein [Microbulbifer sp. SSSA002]|uniref:YncE family protein n=1 Tax=unclassified Microbulbifer TaxID=2619833 RepID=UPI00403A4417
MMPEFSLLFPFAKILQIGGALLLGSLITVSSALPSNKVPPSPSGSKIAVANRSDTTITLIDVASEEKLHIELEPGSEPMYAQNPYYSDEIWIGDRGHSRVLVYDALRIRRIAEIPTGNGVFHMWNHGILRQMWVVNDIDKTMTVISLDTKEVLATVAIPRDLHRNFKPHDITVTATSAIVSLLGPAGEDSWLVEFSGSTFQEIDRLKVPGDPHLMYWGFGLSYLYVASQTDGKLLKVDPDTLTIEAELSIPGAHGIWANEQEEYLYVSDITSSSGQAALYTINISDFTIAQGSPVAAVLPYPHNLMVTIDNDKLFVTHSNTGSEFTTIYDIDKHGIPNNGRIVATGHTPFGIMLVRDPVVKHRKDK